MVAGSFPGIRLAVTMVICREKRFWTAAAVVVVLVILPALFYMHGSTAWKGQDLRANSQSEQVPVLVTAFQRPVAPEELKVDTKGQLHQQPNLTVPLRVTPPPLPPAVGCMDLETLDKDKALILGHRRKNKGFLTIGVTTAKRKNVSYLRKTLKALIDGISSESERSQLSIVVYACDFAKADRQEARDIVASFPEHVQSGLLQLVEAPRSFYPPLSGLKRTYGDPPERVLWRSKENVDVVFLMAYSVEMSDYYMLLDDDMEVRPGYIGIIRNFIAQHRSHHWMLLDISAMGTGKLFRDKDLLHVGRFLVSFYQEKPVDWLLSSMFGLSGQKGHLTLVPPLFKHLGVVSTLGLKNKHR